MIHRKYRLSNTCGQVRCEYVLAETNGVKYCCIYLLQVAIIIRKWVQVDFYMSL